MALSPQWLDELRMRTTLSAVIGRTVRLTKAGREFKACCPFHNEKTPSFYVNDEKGFYHCFGCEAHGDAIRWLTDQRGMPFMDAVKELAAEAGMEVPAPDPRAAERAEKRASLHDVTAAAQQWFVDKLASAEGSEARAYLKRRGFSDAVVREFGFGFAPSDRQALKGALSFPEPMLVEAGMRIEVEGKDPYDRFRGRLMLPIQDARGRVIAFGGRILDADAHGPKYLNSPDTPLFDKGRTLYNLHRAAPAARQSGRIVVVEGYMDAIALANAGIAEAVAPLGTALTENQIELLWRQVERPILCFDGDNAGQRAAMRAIGRVLPMLRPGHSLSIVRMPAGMDPDDLIRDNGVGAMEELLSSPASLLDTLWAFERDAQPLDSPEEKAGLKERLQNHVEAIQHPDIRALYKRELLERFSSFAFPPRPQREFKPRGEWKKGGFNAPPPRLSPETAARLKHAMSGGQRDALATAVIHGLLLHPGEIARHEAALSRFAARDPNVGPAIDSLMAAAETLDSLGESPISLPEGLPAPPANTHFAFLDKGSDPVDACEDLAEAVSLLVERPALEVALAQATARFETDPEGAFAEQQRLLKRKLDFEARLGQMASRKAASVAARDSEVAQGSGPASDE
ncbi:DNA primase [Qipengyuania vesicularis]|uniref:DNA primase n=1 Tax=Qipengyuania vesicularis TaxID=2867232 RepID=UPI001C8783E4|nr:DNA primase [Qipengyuania vesicularis]MBX7526704.1 DNA primase [Qipengyuania vesicularis]